MSELSAIASRTIKMDLYNQFTWNRSSVEIETLIAVKNSEEGECNVLHDYNMPRSLPSFGFGCYDSLPV
jgi:hypothetical protein